MMRRGIVVAPRSRRARLEAARPSDEAGVSGRAGRWAGVTISRPPAGPSNPVSRGGRSVTSRPRHPSHSGAAMFRVSQRGEGIDDADTIDGAREIVRGQSPGRYEVDEIRAEPFPSG